MPHPASYRAGVFEILYLFKLALVMGAFLPSGMKGVLGAA